MATTYNSSASALDRARRLLGDTGVDGGVFLLTDEEIEAELDGERFNGAVANLALGLIARFAQYPDEMETPGGHTIKYRERIDGWREVVKRMETSSSRGTRGGVARLGSLSNPADSRIRP